MTDFYQNVRGFALEKIKPFSKVVDEEKRFPTEAFEELGKEGLLDLLVPEAYNGKGKGFVAYQEALSAVGEADGSVGLIYFMHLCVSLTIAQSPSEELRNEVFKDIVENNAILTGALSEKSTGANIDKPLISVEKKNGKYIINGTKFMVTGGAYAKYYQVSAPSPTIPGAIDIYIVSKDQDGVSFKENQWNGIGMRGNASSPMVLENVVVEETHKISAIEPDKNNPPLFDGFDIFNFGLGAVFAGVNQAISNAATEYANGREYPDNSTLSDLDTIKTHLSQIYTMAKSSLSLCHQAGVAVEQGNRDASKYMTASRINSTQNCMASAPLAMRIGGGTTYNKGSEIEKLFRDAYAGQVMAPSLDALHLILGTSLQN